MTEAPPGFPKLPGWLPGPARRYLAHTEAGQSIRDLARAEGCHASTVLRQVRRMEMRRDDPLIDAALHRLGRFCHPAQSPLRSNRSDKDTAAMTPPAPVSENNIDLKAIEADARHVLRSLCAPGAVLAVAEGMEKAVVVRDDPKGGDARTAIVAVALAQAMALKDWIACPSPGRISRYRITATGRAALNRMLAEHENRARARQDNGMAEAQTPFADQHRTWGEREVASEGGGSRKQRYNMSESPLTGLARRRDRDGKPFLDETLVSAGERLREDFELAQMGPRVTQNWDNFLTGGGRSPFNPAQDTADRPGTARDRVARALADLGPGLSDVALRCCCFLEGLEAAEQRMGWSARSGKIVLRIALQRLKHHYSGLSGPDQMIG